MLCLAVGLAGCTKTPEPVCTVAKTISSHVASEIATQLSCSNVDAIKATLDQKLVDLKVCGLAAESIIGEVICPPLIEALLTGALANVPAAWGCSGGPAKEGLKDLLLVACKKI